MGYPWTYSTKQVVLPTRHLFGHNVFIVGTLITLIVNMKIKYSSYSFTLTSASLVAGYILVTRSSASHNMITEVQHKGLNKTAFFVYTKHAVSNVNWDSLDVVCEFKYKTNCMCISLKQVLLKHWQKLHDYFALHAILFSMQAAWICQLRYECLLRHSPSSFTPFHPSA